MWKAQSQYGKILGMMCRLIHVFVRILEEKKRKKNSLKWYGSYCRLVIFVFRDNKLSILAVATCCAMLIGLFCKDKAGLWYFGYHTVSLHNGEKMRKYFFNLCNVEHSTLYYSVTHNYPLRSSRRMNLNVWCKAAYHYGRTVQYIVL